MKRFLLFLLLLSSYFSVFAIDFYSQAGQNNPNAFASWNTMQGGGGAAPGSFTNVLDRLIIQDGHIMTTTANWPVSAIVIQSGGALQGDHVIQLSGIFRVDDGGTYIHNNGGSVSQVGGMSIFSGTESFAATSNFEIWDWNVSVNGGVPIPNSPAITWGNLIVDIRVNIGEVWNWGIENGATLTVAGNLEINRTNYMSNYYPFEIRITGSGVQTINVGGNFSLYGPTMVAIKKADFSPLDGYTTMQANGNLYIYNYAVVDLGINTTSATTVGLYELRFKGNFSAHRNTVISTSNTPYLVANGTTPQIISLIPGMNCNFRIVPDAIVQPNYYWGAYLRSFEVVLGTLNQNGWGMSFSKVEVAGGKINSNASASATLGNCTVCSGNGSFDLANNTWCTTAGTKGTANFSSSTVTLNSPVTSSFMSAGHPSINSPGDIYFVNSTADIINPALNNAYTVIPNSVFSIDEDSYIAGANAGFNGNGGTLRIGSIDGISATGNTSAGNIRVGGNKSYNNTGVNNFEYFGTNPQYTGDGLPTTISGILKINNTSDAGALPNVTLSRPITIIGAINFTQGKLLTTAASLLNIADNAIANGSPDSYVIGPVRKIGDDDFSFPVGSGDIYSPVAITNVSGSNVSDIFTAEYIRNNPQTAISNAYNPGTNIDHISTVEYWNLIRDNGAAVKKVSLTVSEESLFRFMSRTFISRYDGAAWTNEGTEIIGTPVTLPNGYQTGTIRSFNALSEFGYFTLATDFSESPLPIKLLSFDAKKLTDEKALVKWELSEFPLHGAKFEVQRADDSRSFNTIGAMNGNETSKLYTYTDNGLQKGINYYRLKMIDEDEKITYSRTVAIMNGINGLLLTSLIPTITTNSSTLTVSSSKERKLYLVIVDMYGRAMWKQNHSVGEGNTNIQISTSEMGAGVYLLFGISAEGRTNMIRFIKL